MYSPPPNAQQLSDDPVTRCRQIITILRMIVFALFAGLLIITSIFAVLVYGIIGPPIPGGVPLFGPGHPGLTLVGAVILVADLLAVYFVSRGTISSFQRRLGPLDVPPLDRFAPDPNDLTWTEQVPKAQLFPALDMYNTHQLTRVAMIEGAGVLNAVFFFLEGEIIGLAIVSCTLALLATHFPSPASLNRWLRTVLQGAPE